MRAMRRQATKDLARSRTMGGTSGENHYVETNIFAQQAQIEMNNLPPDRERPRANLYNVIKRLRENGVSRRQADYFWPMKAFL